MLNIFINRSKRQFLVEGHAPDYICSATTALMRSYAVVAERAMFRDGLSMVEIKEDWELDATALSWALQAFLAAQPEHINLVIQEKADVLQAYRQSLL